MSPNTPKSQETAKREEPTKPPEPDAGDGEPPHFDVVRVEPTGEAVLAGKGDPNSKIQLLASGKIIAETKADSSGHFVILPSTLMPGNYDMTLRQTTEGKPSAESPQTVTVSVPQKKDGQVVVALAEPGKATKLLSSPPDAPMAAQILPSAPNTSGQNAPAPNAPAPNAPMASASLAKPETAVVPPAAIKPPGPSLVIRSVELENGNGFFASGAAAAGTHVQVYLNEAHVAEVVAGPDGQWTVTIKKGLTGGHYAVRADAAGEGDAVTARVEVPFDVPVAMAQMPKPAEGTDKSAQPPATSKPGEAKPGEAKSGEAKSGEAKSGDVKSGDVKSGDVKLDEAKPKEAAPDEVAGHDPSPRIVVPPETPEASSTANATPRPDLAAAAKVATAGPPAATPPTIAPDPAAPTPASAPGANAVIEQLETALVVRGDNLWNISRARLGHGKRFTQIYAANVSQIRDPKLIYPGQVFVVPSK